jgi:PIN domain nuclease of toxin-antitoxin system
MSVVLDASAVFALLWNEPGIERVQAQLNGAFVSAVNVAEIYSKSSERLQDLGATRQVLLNMPILIRPFDEACSLLTGELRLATHAYGLSLGDRACLATAIIENRSVMTADKAWRNLDVGVEIIVIR